MSRTLGAPPFPDLLVHEDRFYILAASSLADERPRVLKHGDSFAVFDHYGDVKPVGLGEEGVYHDGTRFLSSYWLRIGPERPLFLSSTVEEGAPLLAVDVTNPDLVADGRPLLARGTVHLERRMVLWEGRCHERLTVRSYAAEPVELPLSYHFDADFADLFEVRGMARPRRGRRLEPRLEDGRVVLAYDGLDGRRRRAELTFAPAPEALAPHEASYRLRLAPGEERVLEVSLCCHDGGAAPAGRQAGFEEAAGLATARGAALRRDACRLTTSNERFNAWLSRSAADLHMLVSDTREGPFPYAGVPWYSTPFGRDGLITALEWLWPYPQLARGVLAFLAAHQAGEVDAERDAEPGKILHEMRRGEMAALGEIPFGRYYGSVDSTPLFVLLAGRYWRRTGDRAFLAGLWPHVEAALDWIDRHGDMDGDGFVEYHRRTERGLVQQGWKDSHDSVFHADGRAAAGPIALCEVQGYVYAARREAAHLARALGRPEAEAAALGAQAEALRRRFEEAFWCDDLGTYALALDGDKRPCRVVTSNPGHCLYTGIAAPERAARVAATLLAPPSFAGWGIRTLAAGEPRFNPMSYHNGSIWPHDNALAAAGLAAYGFREEAGRVLEGLFATSLAVDLHRLPELFCGFPRRPGSSPVLYPVACAPQAWATGAAAMLLEACLGLEIDAPARRLRLVHPHLPPFLDRVSAEGVRVGEAEVDLVFRRHDHDVGVQVVRGGGEVELVVVK